MLALTFFYMRNLNIYRIFGEREKEGEASFVGVLQVEGKGGARVRVFMASGNREKNSVQESTALRGRRHGKDNVCVVGREERNRREGKEERKKIGKEIYRMNI